jgi:transposase
MGVEASRYQEFWVSSSRMCSCVSSARCGVYPSTITDLQWAVLATLLPRPGNRTSKGGRPEKHDRRAVLDAIFYLVRGGLAWRQLPVEFPPWQTVYSIFVRWQQAGVWQSIHDALRDQTRVRAGRRAIPSAAIVDSQSVRASAVVAKASRGWDNGKKVGGRKRHIAVDCLGLILVVLVTAANIQDRDAGHRLIAALRQRFSTITLIWADSGYAGRLVMWTRDVLKLAVQVVKRTDDLQGFVVVPRRWVVERTFAWLFNYRRLIHDHERHTTTHETMIYVAMIMLMSRRLAKTKP